MKAAKNVGFFEILLGKNDFDTVLSTFCCYDQGSNASEMYYSLLNKQNISITVKKSLVNRTHPE